MEDLVLLEALDDVSDHVICVLSKLLQGVAVHDLDNLEGNVVILDHLVQERLVDRKLVQ